MPHKTELITPEKRHLPLMLILGGGILVGAGWFVYTFAEVFKLIIVSGLLAYILDPIATLLESRGLSRTAATILIFLTIVGAFALGVFLLYPVITQELQAMQASGSGTRAAEVLASLESSIQDRLGFLGLGDLNLTEKSMELKRWAGEKMIDFLVTDLASLLAHLVVIPFMMFFFIKDGREIKKALIESVPNRYFELALNLIYRMDQHLGNYLRGQFMASVSFGILVMIALSALQVPYAVFLGAFAGLANLVPYVGPIAGGLLSAVLAFLDTGDLMSVVKVAMAFVAIQLVDESVVQPLTVAKSVEMHPLLVFLVIIAGGQVFGILGMLLSVPVVGFIKIVVEEVIVVVRRYNF